MDEVDDDRSGAVHGRLERVSWDDARALRELAVALVARYAERGMHRLDRGEAREWLSEQRFGTQDRAGP